MNTPTISTLSSYRINEVRFHLGDRVHWRKGSKHGKGIITKISRKQQTWSRVSFTIKTDAGNSVEAWASNCVRSEPDQPHTQTPA